jgi:hypothetical protein
LDVVAVVVVGKIIIIIIIPAEYLCSCSCCIRLSVAGYCLYCEYFFSNSATPPSSSVAAATTSAAAAEIYSCGCGGDVVRNSNKNIAPRHDNPESRQRPPRICRFNNCHSSHNRQ